MSREDIVVVASRLFATFLLVIAVKGSGNVFLLPNLAPFELAVWLTVATAVPLAAAAFLWHFPLTVARKLLPVMRTPGTPINTGATELIDIGCTLLGLWLFAAALSDAIYWLVQLVIASQHELAHPLSPQDIAAIITTVGELLIALWLLLGYKGVVGALRRFRMAGAPD